MHNENLEYRHYTKTTLNVLVAVLVGGLAGAGTMLLLAPRSGEATRKKIQKKSNELLGRTTDMVDDKVAQVRSSANRMMNGGREKIHDIKLQGQDLVVEQLDHISKAAKAGKRAIQGS